MKRLLLVGGGHAHALVLLRFRDFISKHLDVTLVTPRPAHVYSGMVPGVVAGHYAVSDAQIDLAKLSRQAGAELILGSALALNAGGKEVHLDDGRAIPYDVASLNLGSTPGWHGVPGAREHAIAAKPFEPFLAWWEKARQEEPRIAIAGAGAAGVELAMAMRFSGAREVVLYSDRNLFSRAVGERVMRSLGRLAIDYLADTPVRSVEAGPTVVSPAGRERFDALVWAAGPASPALLRESGLKTDDAGFVLTDPALRSASHPEVFAAGDAASMEGYAVPKSGVYAVRQGEVLADNLKRLARGLQMRDFNPQARSLSLISCGAKYAIASRGAWSAEGAWVWRWKDWIDRRWTAQFR